MSTCHSSWMVVLRSIANNSNRFRQLMKLERFAENKYWFPNALYISLVKSAERQWDKVESLRSIFEISFCYLKRKLEAGCFIVHILFKTSKWYAKPLIRIRVVCLIRNSRINTLFCIQKGGIKETWERTSYHASCKRMEYVNICEHFPSLSFAASLLLLSFYIYIYCVISLSFSFKSLPVSFMQCARKILSFF